jgi:hypothetical protein
MNLYFLKIKIKSQFDKIKSESNLRAVSSFLIELKGWLLNFVCEASIIGIGC